MNRNLSALFGKNSDLLWNLTKEYKNETQFVIIPFSKLYNIYFAIMFVTTWYFFLVTPLQIALVFDLKNQSTFNLILDIFFTIVFILDIVITPTIGMIQNENGDIQITTNFKLIAKNYVDNILIFDILAAIPMAYLFMPFHGDSDY